MKCTEFEQMSFSLLLSTHTQVSCKCFLFRSYVRHSHVTMEKNVITYNFYSYHIDFFTCCKLTFSLAVSSNLMHA